MSGAVTAQALRKKSNEKETMIAIEDIAFHFMILRVLKQNSKKQITVFLFENLLKNDFSHHKLSTSNAFEICMF